MSTIGEQIKAARWAKGRTQEQLAKEIRVSRTAVLKWEKGIRFPRRQKRPKLESVLEVKLDWDGPDA